MESGDSKAINGADNSFSPENSPEEEVNNSSDEELRTPKGSEEGSDETIKNLHHEIHSLRLNRSDLHRQIEELKAELEKSDASAKALAAHASYLEGELVRTQEDLSAAMATAEVASHSFKILEKSKDAMDSKITDLELERGRKEGEIRVLREEVRVSKSKVEEMEKLLKDVSSNKSELEVKIAAMDAEARDAVEAEVKIRVSKEEEMGRVMLQLREKNSELGGTVSNYEARFSREEVLENTLKKMVDRNTELERRVGEMALTAPGFSWGTTAAMAASTGAVAIAATAIYLRRPRRTSELKF